MKMAISVAAKLRSAMRRAAGALPGPIELLVRYSALSLFVVFLSRIGIVLLNSDRFSSIGRWWQVFAIGLRVDLIMLGWALALPVLLLPLCLSRHTDKVWAGLSRAWLTAFISITVMLEAASPGFLREYEVRPNRLFLDYLERLQEVAPMLWVGFRGWLVFALAATITAPLVAWRLFALSDERWKLSARQIVAWPLLIVLCVVMIRSSLMHRPANPALFARWNDTLVNQVALNGAYTLGYAIYSMRHEASVADLYGPMAEQKILDFLQRDLGIETASSMLGTWRNQKPLQERARPLNVIVVVEESLGAGFSAALNGEGLTPRLDEWSSKGWWFTQLYATGTRSARGLEAIVAGFPPSPMQSVLKLSRSQFGFATLASALDSSGYRSEFIYGGESHFDNMRGFFLGNGFDAVIDQGDFESPMFRGTWGVSDEDLFKRVHARAQQLNAGSEPYFLLAFTSSNHTPFEYPEGHINPDGEPRSVRNAVRFADHALGKFLDEASTSAYFKDTLVLVVADHDVRVYGDEIIPLQRFRVPALLIGADVRPLVIDSIASQIDLAPTLLSAMGVSADIPFPGRDLTRTLPELGVRDGPEPRAVMQFNDRFACLKPGLLSVLLPGGEVRQYQIDRNGMQSRVAEIDPNVSDHLLAEVHLAQWLYETGAYLEPTLRKSTQDRIQ